MSKLLKMTRMGQFRDRQAAKLSGGMKQKLALMCTLLHKPQVLFLDEPTNGVDPVSRRDFWNILYQLAKDGMTVFVTTAYLDEAERCDRVGLMHQGKLIRCDTPERLKTGMMETCYEVKADDPRLARERLRSAEGVVSAEPAGASLHVFLIPNLTSAEKLQRLTGPAEFREIIRPRRCVHRTDPKSGALIMHAVEVHDVVKKFGNFVAVDHVNLQVDAGEIFGFLGPNGAGKSTTIRILCGLLTPDEGKRDRCTASMWPDPGSVGSTIGYMSQKFSLYDDLTVEENIDFFRGIYGVAREQRGGAQRVCALKMAGLEERRADDDATARGRMETAAGAGLRDSARAAVLFLDEPTSGVDPDRAAGVLGPDLRALAAGTHDLRQHALHGRGGVLPSASALMYRGEVIALGTPEEVEG